MSGAIHGKSHAALKYFHKTPAALAVYWIYVSRCNYENVAWPSLKGLARDTGWHKNTCHEGRNWLIEHQALERIQPYIRPDWRHLEPKEQQRRINLDKSEYYRPTGYIQIGAQQHKLLYFGGDEPSTIDDGLPDRTSGKGGHRAVVDVGPDAIELDSRIELDSSNQERDTQLSEIEKRVTAVLTQLKLAEIKFDRTDYPDRRVLIAGIIERYGLINVQQAIKDSKAENAKLWSYVANRLKVIHDVNENEGLKYISGKYADYIDH